MGKIREDLNKITKGFQLLNLKGKYATKPVCRVTFYNGDSLDFNDKDGLLKLLSAYQKMGVDVKKFVVESTSLVEERRTDSIVLDEGEFDETSDTYICVLYVLKPMEGQGAGRKFRFFVDGRVNLDIINLYYNNYEEYNK